jgi:hypothetical protein
MIASAAPQSERDDRVGVCTHFSQNWSVTALMPLIAKSGVGWIRDDLSWADLERSPDQYQIPGKAKSWIQTARREGLRIDLVLTYGNPAYPDKYDTAAYAKAAGWLARTLRNEVQAIEVLNEPNNFGFRDTYGGAWNGNEANGAVSPYLRKYVDLFNAAVKEIKANNPDMLVIGLGTPPQASFRMMALGVSPEIDGITDHPYGGQLPELVPYAATPQMLKRDGIATANADGTFISQVEMFRTQARKYQLTEKLWHTEWGYSTVRSSPKKKGLSEEEQAVYLLRRLVESHGLGIEHTFIYDFKNESTNPDSEGDNFGLLRNDLSVKPAYGALQRITRLLSGAPVAAASRQAKMAHGGSPDRLGDRCYTFATSSGKTTVVFWLARQWDPGAEPISAQISLPASLRASRVSLVNLVSGNQKEVSAKSTDSGLNVAVPVSAEPQALVITSKKISSR